MAWRELAPRDLYDLRNPLIIDVRSPIEFEQESIPEAINLPLLTNAERAVIGTLYKEEGEMSARRYALKFIAPKIPLIVDQIVELKEHGQTLVLHCWRGGLRSEAVASVLSIAGISCSRLTGGYKAWRSMVVEDLAQDKYPFNPIVLYGDTGCGKTDILEELEGLGAQVLDLEMLANHRGSIFGGMGKGKQPTQKNFEAALWNKLRNFDSKKAVFIEAESRKIGKLALPNSILERIRSGNSILIEGRLEKRVQRILSTYAQNVGSDTGENSLQEAMALLDLIKVKIGKKKADEVKELALAGNMAAAIEILLVDYYDVLYSQATKKRDFQLRISGDDPAQAAKSLIDFAAHTYALR